MTMTLRERIEKNPVRAGMVGLSGCFTVSCITLLGEGLDHLLFFLPLALLNAAVGVFASERVARVIFAVEVIYIFGLLGYQLVQIQERFPNT